MGRAYGSVRILFVPVGNGVYVIKKQVEPVVLTLRRTYNQRCVASAHIVATGFSPLAKRMSFNKFREP